MFSIFSILDIISEFPSQLAADDIEDFCSLAQHYSSKTPQSFRKVRFCIEYFQNWLFLHCIYDNQNKVL